MCLLKVGWLSFYVIRKCKGTPFSHSMEDRDSNPGKQEESQDKCLVAALSSGFLWPFIFLFFITAFTE
jgi:hypothetical protein